MNSTQILELINGILALTPTIVTLVNQIRADIAAGNSDADTAALLDQVVANHAKMLALLAEE